MVHEQDGSVEVALELAQVREHRGDLGGGVLVDAVQAHEGIEHEQRGPQGGDRLAQAILVLGQIQADGRGGDDLQVERLEHDAGGPGNARQAGAHDVERVFGGEEQHAPGAGGAKASQTRRAGGDGDGHIEGEERLAALGLAADDADGLGGPQVFDQPAVLRRLDGEGVRGLHRQQGHRGDSTGRRRALAGAADRGGAKTSR
jgi:hypothetical protein